VELPLEDPLAAMEPDGMAALMEDEAEPLATADEAAEATEVAALAMELPMAPATLL